MQVPQAITEHTYDVKDKKRGRKLPGEIASIGDSRVKTQLELKKEGSTEED